MVYMRFAFKLGKLLRGFYSVNITKQTEPKRLALPFFVAFAFPKVGKLLCGGSLPSVSHNLTPR
jgi:hypothetical protein